ncbi:efflux RND transporter permease subunit [Gemmatimonas groenlandica]|uniref:Efflux RND transporter permease subunit n=2 Tax=Gemmatimonas groenlandica TaxID=2732249 RepID=A0A6M4IUB5_9BACT|nr:efflux RND transporter permease subunit [Gemmatimonas groenlandica]
MTGGVTPSVERDEAKTTEDVTHQADADASESTGTRRKADSFNLSEWGLRHQSLVVFLLLLTMVAGTVSFFRLGRSEDPKYTLKTMIVAAAWPGATTREMEQGVVDRIERSLQEIPYFDNVTSKVMAGEAVLYVNLRDETPPAAVKDIWYQVRKRVGDLRGTLPAGVVGPFFNDDFADTYGSIYAVHTDGFTDAELKPVLLAIRQRLLRLPSVSRVELIGVQDEKIYVEASTTKLARLGIPAGAIFDAVRRQNLVLPSGVAETRSDRIAVRLDAAPSSEEALRNVIVAAPGGRTIRLGDIATVARRPVDPAEYTMHHEGERVVGFGVSMVEGGDILALGEALRREIDTIQSTLPVGISIVQVSDQPAAVKESVDDFLLRLGEALLVVLLVSFLSLGLRTGVIVAMSVPICLAATFVVMALIDIGLHRISLGALIIALGLLVDDAMIAVEMVTVKLEAGWDRWRAASYAWTSTAFPMLSGTLVTAAGFMPVGLAASSTGEYTGAIFWVVVGALLASWVVAVLFTPYLAFRFLKVPAQHVAHDSYDTPRYRRFRRAVDWCVAHRGAVIGATVAAFVLAGAGFSLVPQQFFPSSSRREVLVELELPAGASYTATRAYADTVSRMIAADSSVTQFTSYVGGGSPRFFLALNPEPRNLAYAQFIIQTRSLAASDSLFNRLQRRLDLDVADIRTRVSRLENGPPVGYPVQFRVLGPDPDSVRAIAETVRGVMRANPHVRDVHLQWTERTPVAHLRLNAARLRAVGADQTEVAGAVQSTLSGYPVTQLREGIELVDVIARAPVSERRGANALETIPVQTAFGRTVPLGQVATVQFGLGEGLLMRRSRDVVLPVRGDIQDGTQGPEVSAQVETALASVRDALPSGYRVETGGVVEESLKGQQSIVKVLPLMLLVMVTVLMIQLQSFARVALVILTAPLGLIGVVLALLIFQAPFGFVAQLGVIALAGMIMRNSVILVDQIEQDVRVGTPTWTAIVDATVRRARPIVLTAAAAIFAMIPLTRSAFWGPMAIAIMGGLCVATFLTLFSLPAMYAAWFRVRRAGDY